MAVLTYKCPHCDGGLIFDPEKQAFVCEYCQSSFTEQELGALSPAAQTE
ncbi:MAG: TFIIB-type zinc ribbon-containing protein, partial [Oscillospiraceae bacterium]